MTTTTSALEPITDHAAPRREAHIAPLGRRLALPLVGLAGGLLSSAGLAGIMDAPDPHDSPASMAAHFLQQRDEILAAAPLGYLGAVAIAAFSLGLARRVHARGRSTAAVIVAAAGAAVALYFFLLHLVYTSLAYQVAASSAAATKGLFVPTIMATPALAAATAALLGAAAVGSVGVHGRGVLPRWLGALTVPAAALAAVGMFGYAETGYLYPDVQQQWVGNVLLLWLDVTAVSLGVMTLRRRRGTGS